MHRRAFSLRAAALACAAAGLADAVRAQGGAPAEGREFRSLARPVAVPNSGKIDVIEFFWYGCPHCFTFEPSLAKWAAGLPHDVGLRRAPVAFDARKALHQRIFYTWEALGVLEPMHRKTFARFHLQKKPVDSLADMLAFAQENGLDRDKVEAAWNSFSVESRCREAKRLADDFDIDETPEMAIGGRFVVRARPDMLATADALINRVRYHG